MSCNGQVIINGLSKEEGKELAKYINNLSFSDIRLKVVDDKEAELVCDAIIKLTEGLAFSGISAYF